MAQASTKSTHELALTNRRFERLSRRLPSVVILMAAQRLIAGRGHRYADVLFEPNLASARQSPAYQSLINRLGLPGYWRSAGHGPDICRDSFPPAFCGVA